MEKKIISSLLCLVLALSLVACDNSEPRTTDEGAELSTNEALSEAQQEEIQASDYSDDNNWLMLPDTMSHAADVLYFYPTRYVPESDADPSICGIDNSSMREGAQANLIDQASAFETSADIYAPYYRQVDAMTLAGLSQEDMIEAESGEPKTDVFAALDYYFENYNKGRPYFLAGHSQGSMMIYLILDEYMEQHPERYEKMIAAYMIGNAATHTWLEENPHVKLAQGADDLGVLVTWNTEGPGNADAYNMVAPEGSVCINPLNWRADATSAGVSENKGSLVQDDDGNYVIVEGIADATIDPERGTVICSSVDPALYAIPSEMEPLFGPESYHGWDYKFYYMNIRENAERRLNSYLISTL